MSALQFDDVSKQYPDGPLALSGVGFKVEPGEMLFVTGPSGAGKSTLLKMIYLAERPTQGSVWMDGRNLSHIRGRQVAEYRREVGVVFQDHRLLPDRSVLDNVALPLVLRGHSRFDIVGRVHSALEQLDLLERAHAKVQQLSAGEQQRTGIARALIGEPRLLVADEPIGHLDPELSEKIMTLFSQLSDQGASVIVASHDLPTVKRIKRRVLVLDRGRVIDDISPEDLADA